MENIEFNHNNIYAGNKKWLYKIGDDIYMCLYDGFGSFSGCFVSLNDHYFKDDYHKAILSQEGLTEAEEYFNRYKKRILKRIREGSKPIKRRTTKKDKEALLQFIQLRNRQLSELKKYEG